MIDLERESEPAVHSPDAGVSLPKPTAWPMVFALGLTLLFAGLVTHFIVSLVGVALFARGLVGIWLEVLPRPQHVVEPLQPEADRPAAIEVRAGAVDHLAIGENDHRMRLPREMHPYSAGLVGGLAGAVAMAVVAIGYGLIAEGSAWYPINLLASALLPGLESASLDQLRAFDATALLLGSLIHGALSLLVGLVYAALLPALPGRTLFWGGIVSPIAWTLLVWVSLGLLAPALNQRIDWIWFIASQVAFGFAAGEAISRIAPIAVAQTLPIAQRAGLETQRSGDGATPGGDSRSGDST